MTRPGYGLGESLSRDMVLEHGLLRAIAEDDAVCEAEAVQH
jgi:hypothetical protein